MRKYRAVTYLCIVALAVLMGCSMKKNTAVTRNYTAFITRYNIYFNGDEHYKETLKEMERRYQDDYSQILLMHPAEARSNESAPQPEGDFKRSIEKAQKAIQIRSIKKRPARKAGKGNDPEYKKWLKREEYNPFLHNAWMMMARSQYMNGDFLGAAATFYYVSKHFWWLPATVTEAKLWQARCYCAIDWLFEAESILVKIKAKEIEDNATLQGLYYFAYADLYVKSRDYPKAIPMLVEAIKYAKGAQKVRLTFLLGQLYEYTGDKSNAYAAFKRAGNMSGVDYRTKFNARIKQSEVFQGADISSEVKALTAMTRFGSNRDYLDQIYYAIGNLYLSRADTAKAVDNYEKAIKYSTRSGIDKALAQITLGKVYYAMHEYDKAQPCYSEAVPVLPDNYPDYQMLKRRSDVLDELAVYSQNVTLQDSLLRLSAMSPEQQRAVVDKIIDELKKREKEEAEAAAREEYLAQQAAAGNGLQQNGSSSAPNSFMLNTDKSWYFYNQATRNAGRTEFQKRWGSRRLEDDWRRRNKATFSLNDMDGNDSEDDDEIDSGESPDSVGVSTDREALEHASDPHYPEYYLRQIPSTPEERTIANDVIQEGLYNMGLILKDRMEDYAAAESEFERLMARYPENVYRLDVYYNMYLMYVRNGDDANAEKYRQLILKEFPDTKYGEALADPQYMEKLRRMPEVEQGLYDRAFEAYMDNDNATVHRIYAEVRNDYPMSRIMPKFMFIDALSYVTENNPEKFAEVLQQLLERYPDTDVSPLASSYIKLLKEGRKFNSSGGNVRGLVWSTRLSNDSTAVSMDDTPAQFDFESDGPQLLVLVYSVSNVDGNQLLFEVARHNFSSFMVKDFDLEQLRFGDLGLIVVSGFDTRAELNHYRTVLEGSSTFKLPKGVVPLMISEHNFDILLDQGRSLEEYFDVVGDKRLEQIHESVLPSGEYPSAKEMYAPEEATDSVVAPAADVVVPAGGTQAKPSEPAGDTPYDIPVPPPPSKNAPVLKPKSTSKPAAKPATRTRRLPDYPTGSEGDDPLFD